MVNYDEENGVDGAGAMDKAITHLKDYEWDPTDLEFYFNQVEIKMKQSRLCKGVVAKEATQRTLTGAQVGGVQMKEWGSNGVGFK